MSRLKAKLERKRRQQLAPSSSVSGEVQQGPSPLVQQLQKKIDKLIMSPTRGPTPGPNPGDHARSTKAPRLDQLAGEVQETRFGPVLVNRKTYPPSYRHGRFLAADFLCAGSGLVALSGDESLKNARSERALFLDTETTGLAGGTGTLPFLVGVGWLELDGRFCVEQYFSRNPSEEQAGLELLSARLAASDFLVSFNGKAFDIPLLNTRFVLHRMKNPAYGHPHLDLLHLARRVFKRRLSSCRLGHLESEVLGFVREGDIPGYAIPAAYKEFLRGGPVEPMEAVMEHNALDLVGLAAFGALLERMYLCPETVEHSADQFGLVQLAVAAGQEGAAMAHLRRASDSGMDSDSAEAYFSVAKAAARAGDFVRAKELWYKALEFSPESELIHLALAKHLEHRERDFRGALEHARKAAGLEGAVASAKRVGRLEGKMQRAREGKKGRFRC